MTGLPSIWTSEILHHDAPPLLLSQTPVSAAICNAGADLSPAPTYSRPDGTQTGGPGGVCVVWQTSGEICHPEGRESPQLSLGAAQSSAVPPRHVQDPAPPVSL